MRLVAFVVVACLAVAAGGALVASAAVNITSPETVLVRYDITKLRYVDVGETGGGDVGNVLLLAETLTDQSSGAVVGRARVECKTHIGGSQVCTGAFDIEGRGQIVAEGWRREGGFLAITGGTGAYAGARGEMKLHARDAKGSEYDFSYAVQ